MGDLIQLKRKAPANIPVIEKVIDGKTVQYIDVDALSAADKERYFNGTLFPKEPSHDH